MRPLLNRVLLGLTIILGCVTAFKPLTIPQLKSLAVPGYACSEGNPCALACCSPFGFCGYGPNFCSANSSCIAELSQDQTCNLTSPCDPGTYPKWTTPWGPTYASAETCPLNVCCSPFGFCGTTSDFCGNATVPQPHTNKTASSLSRTIGYYEGWSVGRPCDQMPPVKIPLDAYTHLIYSFLSIDPVTFELVPASPQEITLFPEFTALKNKKPGMEVWLSIGGWAFTDWPGSTAFTFSNLVGSTAAQTTFFASLTSFMSQYGFDGLDIDWEYPVTPDRNGSVADYTNYVTFMQSLRGVLDAAAPVDSRWGLSMTLPSSYWYMQNFDIIKFSKIIDWFNVMTYDLHGTWDAFNPYIGNIMLAHTNLTEIIQTMDLLWRNNITGSQISMGYGFYGRSFTASDPNCLEAGCEFSSGANAGPCTQSPGILSFVEIEAILNDSSRNPVITLDPVAAVQIVTWDTDQWVSFDNAETIKMKQAYADSRGIGGQMVWAVSLDSACGDAASYLANNTYNQCQLDALLVPSSSALTILPPVTSTSFAAIAVNSFTLSPKAETSTSTGFDLAQNPTSGSSPPKINTLLPPIPPAASATGGLSTVDPCTGIVGALRCSETSFAIYGWDGDCGIGRIDPCEGECAAKCLPFMANPGDDNSQCVLVRFN